MNNLPGVVKIVIGITVLLLVLEVAASNRLSTAGLTLDKLEGQKQTLTEENKVLEREIAAFSSLGLVSQKATELGFVKSQTMYITSEYPVALKKFNVNPQR